MYCLNCGKKIDKDLKKCPKCGEPTEKKTSKTVRKKAVVKPVEVKEEKNGSSILLAAIIGVYFVNEHIYVSIGSLIVFLILDMIFMYMMGFLGPITYKTGFLFLLFFLIALSINYAQENEKNGLIAMMILSSLICFGRGS